MLEEELFSGYKLDNKKLISYGFKKIDNSYIYETGIMDNDFTCKIIVNNNIIGHIIDNNTNEEYTNFRLDKSSGYSSDVRNAYIELLTDIRNNCFIKDIFHTRQGNMIVDYYKNDILSFPWSKNSDYGVLRTNSCDKWFALIFNTDYKKIDKNKTGFVEIVNIKIDENDLAKLLKIDGIYKCFHMNKRKWVTIALDDRVDDDLLIDLINKSRGLVNKKNYWIVPANPSYYDVVNMFNDTNIGTWKQSSNINIGDIVYLYVGSPYSRIMYKCECIENNIDYNYKDSNITINKIMKIKLIKRYNDIYTYEYLKNNGISMLRGPRKIKDNLID